MKGTNATKGKIHVHPYAIEMLVDATWQFAHEVLWESKPFNETEVELSKHYIREYYSAIKPEQFTSSVSQHFSAYCQRIVMARNYVRRSPYRYIPHPCIWLNRKNPKGFAGTKKWYERQWRRQMVQNLLRQSATMEELIMYATL